MNRKRISKDFRSKDISPVLINILKAVLEAKDLNDLLSTIRQELSTLIEVRNFYVALFDAKKDMLNFIYHQDEKIRFKEYPAVNTLTGYVIKNGRSLFADEQTQEELRGLGKIGKALDADFEARIWIGVPLKKGQKTFGVVSVQSYDDPLAYSREDMQLMEVVSNTIAMAIMRKQSEDALRESEEKFRTLYDNLAVGLYRTKPSGEIIMANPACVKLLGYDSFDELASRNLEKSGYHPTYDRYHFKNLMEKNNQVIGLESGWKDAEGKYIYVRESARTVRDEDGRILYYDGIVEDITPKKRQELIRDIQLKISHSATTISDLYTLIHNIRLHLTELIETTNFGLAIYEGKQGLYSYPYYIDQNEEVKPGLVEYIPRSLTEYCRQIGRTILIDNEKMKTLEQQGKVELVGPDSQIWLGVPLKTSNGIIGVLSLQSYEDQDAFNQDDIKLLDNVADTIAIVIEKKRAENALKISEQRLSLALESAGLGLWDQDFVSGKVYRNANWARMLGYSLQEVEGTLDFFRSIVHPEDIDKLNEASRQAETGMTENFAVEHRVKAKDGSWKWIYNWGKIIERDQNKKPLRAVGTHLDITGLKQTEQELRLHQEHTKLINSILRHDIANSFAVIKSALNIYHRTHDNTILDEAALQIKKGISLINKMKKLEDYFSLSIQLSKVKLADLINDIASSYVYMKTTIQGNAEILADEALSSVFDNLFANASKHGKADEIEVDILKNDNSCTIIFKDNGSGIPDEIKDKIFDKAFKSGKTGNTGLGLYIIKKTIDRYGGQIKVEDNKPQGAKFVIELKCR